MVKKMLVKTEQFDVVNQWKTILELFYVKTLISRRSMTNALLFLCQNLNINLPCSSKVAAIRRKAIKNVVGEERVTPLSWRHRFSGEGNLKQRAAMDLRAARTSGERTGVKKKKNNWRSNTVLLIV